MQTMQPFACCSRDGFEAVCGMKYTVIDLNSMVLEDGLFLCPTCDNGIVVPDDPLSQSEVSGIRRIKSVRQRREAATTQRLALIAALKPLDEMLKALEKVDPPDFGSFTDWAQRRQEMLATGAATGKALSQTFQSAQWRYLDMLLQRACLASLMGSAMQRRGVTGEEEDHVDTSITELMGPWSGTLA